MKSTELLNIFLIGGSGRSGTTILSRILSLHPDISDVPELRYLIDPDGIIDFYSCCDNWSPYLYDLKLKRLEKLLLSLGQTRFSDHVAAFGTYAFKNISWKLRPQYWGISVIDYCPQFKDNVAELIKDLTDFSFTGHWIGMPGISRKTMNYASPRPKEAISHILGKFLRKTFSQINQRQNVLNYLEKNTWNHIWFDKILEILPESKLVYIYRDPRDVVSSYCQQDWMPSDPRESAIILRDLIRKWEEIKNRIPSHTYEEISLEQLVEQPEETLSHICRFYGVSFHENLLQIDLSKSNRGRWKNHFSTEQIHIISDILQEPIERLGYA